MANYVYITPEQARITHEKTIEYSGGGTLEELDFGRLESVLYNIQNDDWYPTYMAIAATFLQKTENISLNVAASKIDKELLHKIMEAIMNDTFDTDEELKLEIYKAIN